MTLGTAELLTVENKGLNLANLKAFHRLDVCGPNAQDV
jgi:hypothetical protein